MAFCIACSCNLKQASSTVLCFNLLVLIFGIVNVSVSEYDDGVGAAQIVVGAAGFVAALLGLMCGSGRKFFILVGLILAVAVCICWFGIFGWIVDEMKKQWDFRDSGWKTWYVITSIFIFIAAIDHLVLGIAFLKTCGENDEPKQGGGADKV